MSERVPPKLASWLLKRCGSSVHGESLEGDLFEQYQEGRSQAWYWGQVTAAVWIAVARLLRSLPWAGAARVLSRELGGAAAGLAVLVVADRARRTHSFAEMLSPNLLCTLTVLIAVAAVGLLTWMFAATRQRRAAISALMLVFGVIALSAGTLTWGKRRLRLLNSIEGALTMDLAGIFTLVFAAAGLIVLADKAIFEPRRRRQAAGAIAAEPPLVYYSRSFLPVILIVLLLRSFVFEPFRIPSASMMPGLVDGDFILVSKFSYGLRLPLLNVKILPLGEPQRGDVIVFRLPSDPSVHFIKRLIGLPGDHIAVRDNRISVNGTPIPIQPDGTYSGGYGFSGAALALEEFGANRHVVMFAPDRYATDFDAVVPPGRYFFMGDNRNDSDDSRFPRVGFVPDQYLVGHAVRILANWQIPGLPDWRRIGMKIR